MFGRLFVEFSWICYLRYGLVGLVSAFGVECFCGCYSFWFFVFLMFLIVGD